MKIYSSVIIDQFNLHSLSLHPLNLSFRTFAPNECLRILSRLYKAIVTTRPFPMAKNNLFFASGNDRVVTIVYNDIFRHFRKHCEECLCHGLASPHVDQDGSRKA